jgi:hypothetical protein
LAYSFFGRNVNNQLDTCGVEKKISLSNNNVNDDDDDDDAERLHF